MLAAWRAVLGAVVLAASANAQASSAPVSNPLARRVSLSANDVTLAEALVTLRRDLGVPIAWSGDIIPRDHRVSVDVHETLLRDVLDSLLAGTDLEVGLTSGGTIVVVPRMAGAGQADATAGRAPPAVTRAIRATGVQQLDQVVVTGSVVSPAPEREQPTAVGVVGPERIDEIAASRIADVVRRSLPGVILWDRGPAGPPAPIAAVRGVSSFTTRALKTYVDGVEVASPELFTLIDARAVERVELLRGPQGAALYGPDALNGVLQIETRRGRIGDRRRVHLDAAGGAYDRQDSSYVAADGFASAQIASTRAAFAVHAGMSDISSGSAVPLSRSWSAQAGGRMLAGPLIVTTSARAGRYAYGVDPRTTPAASANAERDIDERALGVQLLQQVTAQWQHSLVVGHHQIGGVREASRSPLLPPRLPAGATHEDASRSSVRYGTSLDIGQHATISGGIEHNRRVIDRAVQRTAAATDLSRLHRDELRATGAFAQARVRLGPRLILSAGTRAEDVSSVASGPGLLRAHTAGASWSRELDWATLRLRGAWGTGIRPPEPGMNRTVETPLIVQVANADLEPERQHGVEAGVDVIFPRGSAVIVTWYDQRATGLIQQVQLRNAGAATRTYQFQNVGAVRNAGVEIEASHRMARLTGALIVHVPRSTVLRVARTYAGEFVPGDRLIEVPEAAGSALLRYATARFVVEGGVTWLGAWTGYDWVLIRRAELGQVPERASPRGYWLEYPAVARPYVELDVAIAGGVRATLRVDNPANVAGLIRDNISPPLGRQLLVGLAASR